MPVEESKETLRQLVIVAAMDTYAEVQRLGQEHFFPHWRYPRMSTFENSGLPSFSTSDGPKNYVDALGPSGGPFTRIDDAGMPAYVALLDHLRSSPDLSRHILSDHDWGDFAETILRVTASTITGSLVERLMHLELEASITQIRNLYDPLERGLFDAERPVDLILPLTCITSDVADFEIAPDVRFERLDELTQLGRMALSNWGPVQEVVVGAATHALVVSGGQSPRVPFMRRQLDELPRETAERALQALRIASDSTFGYAQMVVRPNGWASRYKTSLPPLEYAIIERRYPPSVDNYGWLGVPEVITLGHLEEAASIFASLEVASARIRQAARRIDRSQMREDLDDAVVDYCIGLESLLDDSTHTETTHKCALRAATVLASSDGLRTEVVAQVVKRAYALRSAIVHGHSEDKLVKLRTITVDGDELNTAMFVRFVLHRLVIAMLSDASWTEPAEVDRRLLALIGPVVDAKSEETSKTELRG